MQHKQSCKPILICLQSSPLITIPKCQGNPIVKPIIFIGEFWKKKKDKTGLTRFHLHASKVVLLLICRKEAIEAIKAISECNADAHLFQKNL